MNKKRIILIALCVVVSLLLLWIVYKLVTPARTYLNLEMVCTEVALDGTVLSTGNTVTIKGWEVADREKSDERSLVLDEFAIPAFPTSMKLFGDFPFNLKYPDHLAPGGAGFGTFSDPDDIYDLTLSHTVYISFEKDWRTCLINLDGERFFACSLDGTVAVSEILENHAWLFHD